MVILPGHIDVTLPPPTIARSHDNLRLTLFLRTVSKSARHVATLLAPAPDCPLRGASSSPGADWSSCTTLGLRSMSPSLPEDVWIAVLRPGRPHRIPSHDRSFERPCSSQLRRRRPLGFLGFDPLSQDYPVKRITWRQRVGQDVTILPLPLRFDPSQTLLRRFLLSSPLLSLVLRIYSRTFCSNRTQHLSLPPPDPGGRSQRLGLPSSWLPPLVAPTGRLA